MGVLAQGVLLPWISKKLTTNQLMYSAMFAAVLMYLAFTVAFQGVYSRYLCV